MKYIVGTLLTIILLLLLVVSLPGAKIEVGKGDFIAYWSASHLLSQGKNPYDVLALLSVERKIGWTQEYPYMVWNPPWLHLLLLPYAWLPFTKAAALWLITNIVFIYICSVALWRLFSTRRGQRWWVAPLVAFTFPPTLVTLITGQINTLVLVGIVGSVFCITRGRDSLGGLMLFLTTVKPQLVYIFLPTAFLWLTMERRWASFASFGATIVAAISLLSWRLPSWLDSYLLTTLRSPLLRWETPTIGGIVSHYFGTDFAKYLGVIVLPISLSLIIFNKQRLDLRTASSMILLVSLPTAIFGWSYDQVVLMFPLMQIVVWVVEGELGTLDAVGVISSLLIYNVLMLYLRLAQIPNEMYYFWVPIAIAITYLYSLAKIHRRATSKAVGGSPA